MANVVVVGPDYLNTRVGRVWEQKLVERPRGAEDGPPARPENACLPGRRMKSHVALGRNCGGHWV